MSNPGKLFLVLAALALLASGCARSPASLLLPTGLPPAGSRENTPAVEAGLSIEVMDQTPPARPSSAASATPLTLTQTPAAPALTPSATALATATRSRQPYPVSDLVYLSQDRLMRWDPLTRHAISLAQNVTAFTVSPDGQKLILLRPQKITANGVQLYHLDALHLQEQRLSTLLGDASLPGTILVSPDGSQLAYTQRLAQGSAIFLLPAEPGSQPRRLATCRSEPEADCASLVWSPKSDLLLWSDASGLWQISTHTGAAESQAQLVHPNKVHIQDPKGQNLEIEARFLDLQFAPSERFVLLKVAPLASEVGWQAVFDRRSGQMAQAQETFSARPAETLASWHSNGSLIVAHASQPDRGAQPFVHLWWVMPTSPELLVSGKQYNLYSDEFPFSAAQSKAIPAHCLHWLAETQPDHLAFAVRLDQANDPPVLFDLNLQSGSLTKLLDLPADTTQVLWAPDGVNALVLGGRNQIYWLSLKTAELTGMQAAFGPDARQFVWLPAVLRR